MRPDFEVIGDKLYPVGSRAWRVSGRREDFFVFLVVPEVGNLHMHIYGRVAGIDRGKIKLERNARLECFHHLGRRQPQRLRTRVSGQSGQAEQPAQQVIQNVAASIHRHQGTVNVKVSVAESLPLKDVAPLAFETNNPRNRVIELRLAAAFVICVAVPAVVPMLLYGPAPVAASRNIRMVGWAKFVLTKVLIVAMVEVKSVKAGCRTYGVE